MRIFTNKLIELNRMRIKSIMFLCTIFLFNSLLLYSQDSTNLKIKNLQEEIEQLKLNANKQAELKESLFVKAEQDIELASKIIDWSALILTVLTVILVIAGAIGLKEFSNIRKIETEIIALKDEMKDEIENMKNFKTSIEEDINNIKRNIKIESKDFLRIIYLLNEGISYFQSGDLSHAIESFLKVKEINPNDYEATCYLARSYTGQEKYNDAIEIAKSAITLTKKPARAYMIIGEVHRRRKEYDDAIISFKKSIELDKRSSTFNNLGYSYFNKNDFDNALKTFREALDLRRNNHTACCGLAKSYLKKGFVKEAHDYFQETILLANENLKKGTMYVWPYYNLAFAHLALNHDEECIKNLTIALEMNKNPSLIKEHIIGHENVKGDKAISQELLEKCLNLFSNTLYNMEIST